MNQPVRKVTSLENQVTVFDHKSRRYKTMTVLEAIKQLLHGKKDALAMLESDDFEVTVQLGPNGCVQGVLFVPKDDDFSPDYLSCICEGKHILPTFRNGILKRQRSKWRRKARTLIKKSLSGQKVEFVDGEDGEELMWDHSRATVGPWWRNQPKKEIEVVMLDSDEEEVDLDLMLQLDDNEVEPMEVNTVHSGYKSDIIQDPRVSSLGTSFHGLDIESQDSWKRNISDVFEATQLPPERISRILKRKLTINDDEVQEPDSTVNFDEDMIFQPQELVGVHDNDEKIAAVVDDDDDDPEAEEVEFDDDEITNAWKRCWNCKAPSPPDGIYRENANKLQIVFCCDKPTRVKPTNTSIKSTLKSYPYDSWVNHGYS